MKIGNGWTKKTDDGDNYISVSLDEVVLTMYPMLKDCFITLWHIPPEERKKENSPGWSVNISAKKEDKEKQTQEIPV